VPCGSGTQPGKADFAKLLSCWCSTLSARDFRLNGRPTGRAGDDHHRCIDVGPDTFVSGCGALRLASASDTDQYRSWSCVTRACGRVLCATLAFFGSYGLIDGTARHPQTAGTLPGRATFSAPYLDILRQGVDAWPLLSLLNVRQAIAGSCVYMEPRQRASADVLPSDVTILTSVPTVPRQFFARGIAPVADATERHAGCFRTDRPTTCCRR